jgi:LuxR family transcriptional regulator, maltose regulon positive regulatory protein
MLCVLAGLGDTEGAEQALAALSDTGREHGEHGEHGEIGVATAVLRLAQDDPRAATAALAPAWRAPLLSASETGWPGRTSWKRSPWTRSAIRSPPNLPWSAR